MKRMLLSILLISVFLFSGCMVSNKEYESVQLNLSIVESEKNQVLIENKGLQSQIEALNEELISLETNINNTLIESEIKSDYIELYQYLVLGSYYEGGLSHQYNRLYNGDSIYIYVYQDNLNLYKGQIKTTNLKITRLIEKLNKYPSIDLSGIPEDLDTISELEDLSIQLDVTQEILKEYVDLLYEI